MADIAGKGIAAALLMSVVQASLRVMAESASPASQLAAQMNRFLYAIDRDEQLRDVLLRAARSAAAGACATSTPGTTRRTWCAASARTSRSRSLSAGGTVLGLVPGCRVRGRRFDLRAGDLLVAFTDGVTEARNADGEEFGEDRLKDFLRGAVGASADEISSTLADRMREWIAGAEQHDDVTFVIAAVN